MNKGRTKRKDIRGVLSVLVALAFLLSSFGGTLVAFANEGEDTVETPNVGMGEPPREGNAAPTADNASNEKDDSSEDNSPVVNDSSSADSTPIVQDTLESTNSIGSEVASTDNAPLENSTPVENDAADENNTALDEENSVGGSSASGDSLSDDDATSDEDNALDTDNAPSEGGGENVLDTDGAAEDNDQLDEEKEQDENGDFGDADALEGNDEADLLVPDRMEDNEPVALADEAILSCDHGADPATCETCKLSSIERPGASETVDYVPGAKEELARPLIKEKNWEIYYDPQRDVYKVTFNIDEQAEGNQIIDLTRALGLLYEYSEYAEGELEAEIDTIPKPEKSDLGYEAPQKADVIEDKLQKAADKVLQSSSSYGSNKQATILKQLVQNGFDQSDPYIVHYAQYLADKANLEYAVKVIDKSGRVGATGMSDYKKFVAQYCPDYNGNTTPTAAQKAAALAAAKAKSESLIAPEFSTGDDSATQQGYESTRQHYDNELSKWNETLTQLKENGAESSEEYLLAEAKISRLEMEREILGEFSYGLNEYLTKLNCSTSDECAAALQAYASGVVAWNRYQEDLATIEKQFKADTAEYNARVWALEREYKTKIESYVLEPGDVRKFEMFITSDSKHTYKYKTGSFTLATPDLKKAYALLGGIENDGIVVGFDGQNLAAADIRNVTASVSYRSEPMYELFCNAGISSSDISDMGTDDLSKILHGQAHRASLTSKQISKVLESLGVESDYTDEDLQNAVTRYVIDYYSTAGETYADFADLIMRNPEARNEFTSTKSWQCPKIGGQEISHDLGKAYNYDNFYKNLLNFAFGAIDSETFGGTVVGLDKEGHAVTWDEFLGGMTLSSEDHPTNPGLWSYENHSWTDNGYKLALYYYMLNKGNYNAAGEENIWQVTDSLFEEILSGATLEDGTTIDGLTNNPATWAALMMAVNIDAELGSSNNDTGWQDILRGWYSSIELEQMDIDFRLSKTDEEGEPITESETGFQIYYIDNIVCEDGSKQPAKFYCTYDPDTDSYSFVLDAESSVVYTKNGTLAIDYAMMKDIVYYLQEKVAPEGYELDPNVYVIVNGDIYADGEVSQMKPQDQAEIEEIGDSAKPFVYQVDYENGIAKPVQMPFVNVKIPSENPDPTPTPTPSGEPTPTPTPSDEPTPTPTPSDEPTPTPAPSDEPTPTPPVTPPGNPNPPEDPQAEMPEQPRDETAGWNQDPWVPDWIVDTDDPTAEMPDQPSDETAGWHRDPWVPDWITDPEDPEAPNLIPEVPTDETVGWRVPGTEVRITRNQPRRIWRDNSAEVPQTDDTSSPAAWLILACGAAIVATAMAKRIRRPMLSKNK